MLAGFVQIEIDQIIPDTRTCVDLFIESSQKMVLYCKDDAVFTPDKKDQLVQSGRDALYIRQRDRERFMSYVEANLSGLLGSRELEERQKIKLLYDSTVKHVEEMFSNPYSAEVIQRNRQTIRHTVDMMLKGPNLTRHFIQMTSHDYQLHTHAINVSIYGVALAREVFGPNSAYSLHEIGGGLLLHDIGKSLIDRAILNKPGTLNNAEWERMKKHPEDGYKILRSTGQISDVLRACVMEHHERFLGGGYPTGKSRNEISVLGRIAKIVNVFDALTTRRSYRDALGTFQALQLMMGEMKDEFDPYILERFVKVMGAG